MRSAITVQRMRDIEQAYMETSGTPGLVLMERAARAVADTLLTMTQGGALFLCGPGNNGGDGYAAARLFAEAGRNAWIWTVANPEMLQGDARANMERCASMKLPIRRLFDLSDAPPEGCAVVVDALFGTGLARPLDGLYADAAAWINTCGLPVLAVDMPSGTPELMVRADQTVTFHQAKLPHYLFPGRANSGKLLIADIGIPDAPSEDGYALLDESDVPRLLPPRPQDAHKGMCGHALLLAGSFGMAGAAALCANAALRGGAGLVTAVCPREIILAVQALAPCAMCALPDRLEDLLPGKAAIAAGPGLGRAWALDDALKTLLLVDIPQVWDADALRWLAENPESLDDRFLLTPHPGEAARLLGCGVPDITADPIAAAEALRARFGAVVLLKGATTVILGDGRRALNLSGTPGMATGGAGDVLTGLIAALLAQGLDPFDAASLGAFLHGRAGEAAAAARGIRSMTAEDLLHTLRID